MNKSPDNQPGQQSPADKAKGSALRSKELKTFTRRLPGQIKKSRKEILQEYESVKTGEAKADCPEHEIAQAIAANKQQILECIREELSMNPAETPQAIISRIEKMIKKQILPSEHYRTMYSRETEALITGLLDKVVKQEFNGQVDAGDIEAILDKVAEYAFFGQHQAVDIRALYESMPEEMQKALKNLLVRQIEKIQSGNISTPDKKFQESSQLTGIIFGYSYDIPRLRKISEDSRDKAAIYLLATASLLVAVASLIDNATDEYFIREITIQLFERLFFSIVAVLYGAAAQAALTMNEPSQAMPFELKIVYDKSLNLSPEKQKIAEQCYAYIRRLNELAASNGGKSNPKVAAEMQAIVGGIRELNRKLTDDGQKLRIEEPQRRIEPRQTSEAGLEAELEADAISEQQQMRPRILRQA